MMELRRERGPWPVFAVTGLGAFVVALDLSIVNVAFPALARAFPDSSRADMSWVVTAYAIAFGALLVIGGRTADRVGYRRVFFLGLGSCALGSALCGAAPSTALLVAGRAVQGVGAAFMLPAALGSLLAVVRAEQRSQMIALFSAVSALAVATGPAVGALLVVRLGWRAVFYVNLPLTLATYLIGLRVLPAHANADSGVAGRSPAKAAAAGSRSAPDYLGAALLGLCLSALVMRLITPKRLKENEEFIHRLTDQTLNGLIDRGKREYNGEFASPLAMLVVADLLGVPDDDRKTFREVLLHGHGAGQDKRAVGSTGDAKMAHSPLEFLYERFTQYIEDRRARPRGDVLTGLANAKFPRRLDPGGPGCRTGRRNLFAAGQETTVRLLSSGVMLLADNPALQQKLRTRPDLIPNFVLSAASG